MTDRGVLTIVSSRPHQGRWLVFFEGIVGREAAETWRGVVLRGEPIVDPGALWVHELIGSRVLERDGRDHGVIVAVQDNPASDLMVLDSGALVPLTFLVDGPTDGIVHVEVPDGLFELYEG